MGEDFMRAHTKEKERIPDKNNRARTGRRRWTLQLLLQPRVQPLAQPLVQPLAQLLLQQVVLHLQQQVVLLEQLEKEEDY